MSASTLAYEIIEDVSGSNTDTVQDLRRTRQILPGAAVVQNTDATIIADNAVDPDFGKNNSGNVSYTHLLTWLAPPAASYLNATLTIVAYDVNGNNDGVTADVISLGNLNMLNNGVTTTIFNSVSLLAQIIDNNLNVVINKQGENNGLNVLSSRLDVEYNAVPEPVSLVLLGLGLAAGAARKRFMRPA